MTIGWTYRQYDLFRKVFGLYLVILFFRLISCGAEIPMVGVMVSKGGFIVGTSLSMLFLIGIKDRISAALLFLIFLWAFNPVMLLLPGAILLAHLFIPKKPRDPFGKWSFPKEIFAAAWVMMAAVYTYCGYTYLSSPFYVEGSVWFVGISYLTVSLELFFAPMALFQGLRPFLWTIMFFINIGFGYFDGTVDLTLAVVMIHLFTFNPAWVVSRNSPIKIYYDGECGFCHKFIQFVLQELPKGSTNVTFAPQQEESKTILVCDEQRGITLRKTEAIEAILKSLGGIYRIGASVIWLLPFSDFFYDCISAIRHKFFEKPAASCPVIPSELDALFKDE